MTWLLALNGSSDRYIWNFEADGWRLRCEQPAYGTLGILPFEGRPPATLDDARWLADVFAFDHDAPIGVIPAMADGHPKDPEALPVSEPVHSLGEWTRQYWNWLNAAFAAVAENRFNGTFVLRYDEDDDSAPRLDFSERFKDLEELVGLYAMAARQADILSEFLLLYRLLEAADGANGTQFVARNISQLRHHDFGTLIVIDDLTLGPGRAPNAFEVYRARALEELDHLESERVLDVAQYLYQIRNSLAHGKARGLHPRHPARFAEAAHALPIVKLLARIAVEP